MRLKNKVAIVTGAASGIGKAIAEKFLKEGAKVVFADVSLPTGFTHNETQFFIQCDVSKSDQVDALIRKSVEKFRTIDIMVNNAGIGTVGGILETTDEIWNKTIGVNLSGVFYGIRAAARVMKEKNIKGSIINISSILGEVGMAGAISYCASKGGIVQLTHAAALDLAPLNIKVNAIAPGFIETNMTKESLANPDFQKMVESNTPLGHAGKAEDIANTALFLASDESPYITGDVLFVDGGWTAR